MKQETILPDYIFSTSWEVCNKVGGIYTVLSTQAKTLQAKRKDHLFYVGPDRGRENDNNDFLEDTSLLADWHAELTRAEIPVRIGRWDIPGKPIIFLVGYQQLFSCKDEIYQHMWDDFQVDSLHSYGDYDESCLFSYAAGRLTVFLYDHFLKPASSVVYQAHEWMSGFGLLYVKKHAPAIGTIFTTHATSIGRSITSNNKPLYDYFEGYYGDQMAEQLNMQSKHSIEKQAALQADCLTTVSDATDKECLQFFGRKSDVILLNGFEQTFVPKGPEYTKKRRTARQKTLQVANQLLGLHLDDDTVILSTSGRNDFRCKGYDVLIDSFARMQREDLHRDVLALIVVPCWKEGPRKDLQERMASGKDFSTPLPDPFFTHTLYNRSDDRIISTLYNYGISFSPSNKFHVLLIPSYLDGRDGILNLTYYDWLIGCDLCLYPSYYEPWGYTCLESIAFHIPCLTTDLSGFGQWANHLEGGHATLESGVEVIHRSDSNYEQAAAEIANTITRFMVFNPSARQAIARKCSALAQKALWKDFINNYYKAFCFALRKAEAR